MSSLNAQLSI